MKKVIFTYVLVALVLSINAQVQVDKSVQLTGTGSDGKLTGIKVVNAPEDAVSAAAEQMNTVTYAPASNLADAFAVSLTPAPGAYTTGLIVHFKSSADISGPATLDVNSLGQIPIKKNYNVDLVGNDIRNGQMVSVMYDGTNFQMLTPPGSVYNSSSITSIPSKYIFITSVLGNGNLSSWAESGGQSGLTGADNVCQSRAVAAGLPTGTYQAFLSTSTVDACARFANVTLPIINTKGSLIFYTGAEICSASGDAYDNSAFRGIVYNESGVKVTGPSETLIYTGSGYDGRKISANTCSDWTNSSSGLTTNPGDPVSSGSPVGNFWKNNGGGRNCSQSLRLVCIQL